MLHDLEEVRERAQKIEDLETSLQKALDERAHVAAELEKLGPQISETQHRIASLSANPRIVEVRRINTGLKELRGELLASGFRRLGRPLRKLEAMAGRGEYPLAPELRERLSEYLKRPFTTFTSEKEGHPDLKSVLRSTREAMGRKKLVLKHREERKVLERIENVAERNTLDRIHREATALMGERKKRLQDPESVELVQALKREREDLKALRSKHTHFEDQSQRLFGRIEGFRASLTQSLKETGLFVEKLGKKPVRIDLDRPDLLS